MRVYLENVVVIIADTHNYQSCVYAIKRTLKQIKPAKLIWFTDIELPDIEGARIYKVKGKISSKEHYSAFLINEVPHMLKNMGLSEQITHALVIQHDGFVLNGWVWNEEWLQYDYIGAPWLYIDGRNVGNGGFSLRSLVLMDYVSGKTVVGPEDECIGRLWRGSLELSGFKFAPEPVAHEFSYELNKPKQPTFGFHGIFHEPHKKTILVKRMGAMGDVIQVEPVLCEIYKLGFDVYLQTQPQFYQLFLEQKYPVYFYDGKKEIDFSHVIDLDMSYENSPMINHIEAYFNTAILAPELIRNPKIEMGDIPRIIEDKYVVFHIDKRAQNYRNPVFDFAGFVRYMNCNYKVVIIGNGTPLVELSDVIRINTTETKVLKSIIGYADKFIGVDSGPSHLAVAMGVRSIIFFGSVLPQVIHYDLSNIMVMQGKCEYQGCWHEFPGTEGQPCKLGLEIPKCCNHEE
jgi:hypothetical protein